MPEPPGPRPGPRRWPLAGHVVPFLHDTLGFLEDCARSSGGGAVRLDLPGPACLLTDADDVQHVLQTRSDVYEKGPLLTSPASRRVTGEGVLTSLGAEHLVRKRGLQPLFTSRAVEAYAETVVDTTRAHVAAWREGTEIEAAGGMQALAQEIVGRILFGDGYHAEAPRLAPAIRDRRAYLAHWYAHPLPLRQFLPFPVILRYPRAVRVIADAVYRQIGLRRERPHADLAARLLNAEMPDGSRLRDAEAHDELRVLAVTGYETIGETLAWTLYLVSRHPGVESRMVSEIDAVLGGRTAVAADAERLRYLKQVVAESMRLYPATWLFTRRAREADRLPSGSRVAAGTKVFVCPWILHRSPGYFALPERFDPDRFGEGRRPWPAFAYIPFGGGLRVCIGQALAKMELVLALASIYQGHRLHFVAGQRIVPHPGLTLTPRPSVRLVVERRSSVPG